MNKLNAENTEVEGKTNKDLSVSKLQGPYFSHSKG